MCDEQRQPQPEPTIASASDWPGREEEVQELANSGAVLEQAITSGSSTWVSTVELGDLRRRAARADELLQAQLRQAGTIVRLRSEVGVLKERLLDLDDELTLEQRGCELWQDTAELRERRRAALLARVQRTAQTLEQSIRRIPCHESAEREAALALVAELRSEVTT
jgi:predicted  nucleic acid-binding Zn-ribbon protein